MNFRNKHEFGEFFFLHREVELDEAAIHYIQFRFEAFLYALVNNSKGILSKHKIILP